MSSDSENSQQMDPALYQYDQVYEEIKGNKSQQSKQTSSKQPANLRQHRERSRQKQPRHYKTAASKYINKMKQVVQQRQKAHEYAHQKKIERQNQRLGVKPEEVFVTESYLNKKRQEKQLEKKQKDKEKYDEEHSILNKKKNLHDFTRKLLEQSQRKH